MVLGHDWCTIGQLSTHHEKLLIRSNASSISTRSTGTRWQPLRLPTTPKRTALMTTALTFALSCIPRYGRTGASRGSMRLWRSWKGRRRRRRRQKARNEVELDVWQVLCDVLRKAASTSHFFQHRCRLTRSNALGGLLIFAYLLGMCIYRTERSQLYNNLVQCTGNVQLEAW